MPRNKTKAPRRSKEQMEEQRLYAYQLLRQMKHKDEVVEALMKEYGLTRRTAYSDYLSASDRLNAEKQNEEYKYVHEIKHRIKQGVVDKSLIMQQLSKKYSHLKKEELEAFYKRAWDEMHNQSPTDRKQIRLLSSSRYNDAIIKFNHSLQRYDERIAEIKGLIEDLENKGLEEKDLIRETRLNQALIADIEAKKVATVVQITAVQSKLDDLHNLHTPKMKNRFEELLKEIEGLSVQEQEAALINAVIAKALETGNSNDAKAALQLINEESYGKVGEVNTNLSVKVAEQIAEEIEKGDKDVGKLLGILGQLEKVA